MGEGVYLIEYPPLYDIEAPPLSDRGELESLEVDSVLTTLPDVPSGGQGEKSPIHDGEGEAPVKGKREKKAPLHETLGMSRESLEYLRSYYSEHFMKLGKGAIPPTREGVQERDKAVKLILSLCPELKEQPQKIESFTHWYWNEKYSGKGFDLPRKHTKIQQYLTEWRASTTPPPIAPRPPPNRSAGVDHRRNLCQRSGAVMLVHHEIAMVQALAGVMQSGGTRYEVLRVMPYAGDYPAPYERIASALYAMIQEPEYRDSVPFAKLLARLKLPENDLCIAPLGKINQVIKAGGVDDLEVPLAALREYRDLSQLAAIAERIQYRITQGYDPVRISSQAATELGNVGKTQETQSLLASEFSAAVLDEIGGNPPEGVFAFQQTPLGQVMGVLYEDGCAIQGAPGGRKSTVARWVMVEAALQGKTSMIALLESNRTKFVHQMACMIANDLLYRWGYTYDGTDVFVSIDSEMLRTNDRRLQTPLIQAALAATRTIYRALQPYWLVADRHDGVRDTRILTRKIYEGLSLHPDLSLLIVDNGNYGNVYDDQGREIHDLTTRTRLQAEWMMKIKDQVPALAPIYLWHTNAEGASSGGQAIPRVADKILQVEYQQTAHTMAERDNLARLKMWVVKGREMGSGEDTAIHLWLERAGGAIHAWNLPDQSPRICRLFPDHLYQQCGIDIRPRQLAQGDLL